MARILGIDWAVDAKDRAAVMLDVSTAGIEVVEVRATLSDDEAGSSCKGAAVVAVDVPFGWPREFVDFVKRWKPSDGQPAPPPSDGFRLRQTDRRIREIKPPLSVSTDLIGLAARSWTEVVARHLLGPAIDVEGSLKASGPTIIEVYPAATLVALGFSIDKPSYKKDAGKRTTIVTDLAARFSISLGPHLAAIVRERDRADETDALVAALTGVLYLRTIAKTAPRELEVVLPAASERDLARTEGWIFAPAPGKADDPRGQE